MLTNKLDVSRNIAKIDNSNNNQHSGSGRNLAIIAIVIAIIALTLAWMTYNRSGKDLEDSVTDSIEGTSQNAGDETQRGLGKK